MSDDSEKLYGLKALTYERRNEPIERVSAALVMRNVVVLRTLKAMENAGQVATNEYHRLFVAADKSIRGLIGEQTKRALAMATIAKTLAGDMTTEEANKALEDIVSQRISMMSPKALRTLAILAEEQKDLIDVTVVEDT